MKTIRCSQLDALFACGPSVFDEAGNLRIDTADDEASEVGKLVHSLAGSLIETGRYDLAGECERRGIEADDDLAYLMGQVERRWSYFKRYFKDPVTERVVTADLPGDVRLRGTLDAISAASPGQVVFIDWKSGRLTGHKHQMYGYATCAWNAIGRPADAQIVGIVAYLRTGKSRIVRYPADKLREWENDLLHNILPRLNQYSPGEHCARCSLFHACPARRQIVSGTVEAMLVHTANAPLGNSTHLLSSLTPDTKHLPEVRTLLTDLRYRSKLVQRVLDDLHELIRQTVERVGPIDLDDETALTLREVETRSLDPLPALKVLRQSLSDSEIAAAMKLSLPKLLSAVAAKYGKGTKGKARDQLTRQLADAGALNVSVQHRLEEVDKGAQNDEVCGTSLRDEGAVSGTVPGGVTGAGQRQVRRRPALPGRASGHDESHRDPADPGRSPGGRGVSGTDEGSAALPATPSAGDEHST